MIQRLLALVLFLIFLPFFGIVYLWLKIKEPGPFLFTQTRIGKDKKPFTIYKIRTMVVGAEEQQSNYDHLNEADGPVFKIRHDPRYTRWGKFLSHTGLDELPQLINIIKGDMAFVGPRPLPAYEAAQIPKEYESRFSVLPGITSSWVIRGAHKLSFEEWMKLDVEYAEKKIAFWAIVLGTILIIARNLFLRTKIKEKSSR